MLNDYSFCPKEMSHFSTVGGDPIQWRYKIDSSIVQLSRGCSRGACNRLSRADLTDRRSIHRTIVIREIVYGSIRRYAIVHGTGRSSEPADSSSPLEIAENRSWTLDDNTGKVRGRKIHVYARVCVRSIHANATSRGLERKIYSRLRVLCATQMHPHSHAHTMRKSYRTDFVRPSLALNIATDAKF